MPLGVTPPGLSVIRQLGSVGSEDKPWDQLTWAEKLQRMAAVRTPEPQRRDYIVGSAQDPSSLVGGMSAMVAESLPWVPAQTGDASFYESPQYREIEAQPTLAKLGKVATMGTQMRGGIGQGPRWMRNKPATTPEGAPIRPRITDEMLTAARAGDETARAGVIDGLQDMIAKIAYRYHRPGQGGPEITDIIAEGNVAALQVLNKAQQPEKFLPYVQGAIENRISNFVRGGRQYTKRAQDIEGLSVEDISARIPDMPRKDLNALVNEAMAQLTEKQRAAVQMRLGVTEILPEGANLERIGEAMGISKVAAHKLVTKGMTKFKAELKARGLDLGDIPETGKTKKAPPTSQELPVEEAVPPVNPTAGGSGAAKAEYYGFQPGFKDVPGFHMYNLTEDVKDAAGKVLHTKGSTVSEDTLKRLGIPYDLPPTSGLPSISGGSGQVFAEGSKVRLLHDPERTGVITGRTQTKGNRLYYQIREPLKGGAHVSEIHSWIPEDQLVPSGITPIAGGSAPEMSPLGQELAKRLGSMRRGGGGVQEIAPTPGAERYEPSWPSESAATADAADSMNLGAAPGSYALDLQRDPNAIRKYLEMLDSYYGEM